MKIRNGFVSNSSSSSFILRGREVDIMDIDINNINFNNKYIVVGPYISEGCDLFYINDIETLFLLRKYKDIFKIYEIDLHIENRYYIDEHEAKKTFGENTFVIYVDRITSTSYIEVIENHGLDTSIEEIENESERFKKIKRLIK